MLKLFNMFKNYKYLLFLFLTIGLFLGVTLPVLALELDYPSLTGFGGLTPTLPGYVAYIFWFIVISSGTIGIISIVISAFKILVSFGKPEAIGEARKNIFSIVIGIFLLMTSVIILGKINTEIVSPSSSTTSTIGPGVYLSSTTVGVYENIQAPLSESDTENIRLTTPASAALYYKCDSSSMGDIIVWTYSQKFFKGNVKTYILTCNTAIPIGTGASPPVLSFQRQYKDYGVYFFSELNCQGYSTKVKKSSSRINMNSRVKSMQIISGQDRKHRYGVILSKSSRGINNGECSKPVIKYDAGFQCYDFFDTSSNTIEAFNPQYAFIINYDPEFVGDPTKYEENAVDLYSERMWATIWQKPVVGGVPGGSSATIGQTFSYFENPDKIIHHQHGQLYPDVKPPYENECCTAITSMTVSASNPYPCNKIDYPRTVKNFWVEGFGRDTQTYSDVYRGNCFSDGRVYGSYYVFVYGKNKATRERSCSEISSTMQSSLKNISDEGQELYGIVIVPKF